MEEKSPVSLPSLPQLEFSDLPSLVHGPGSYPGIYDLLFSQFSNIDEASWLLWNTFNELEDEVRFKFPAAYITLSVHFSSVID
jgi:N-hydroxythioamide S-beta-glucosyltransferase